MAEEQDMSKQEATRLADALEAVWPHDEGRATREAAAALLRRWPDAGEPVGWRWQSPVGGWAYGETVSPHAISGGFAVQPLYTAPPAESERIAALEAEADEWRKLLDPHTLHANLVRGLPAQLTLEQRRHLAGNDERIAALEAALAERDRVIEIAQEMAEYLRNSSICQADTEAAEEVIRAIEEVQR